MIDQDTPETAGTPQAATDPADGTDSTAGPDPADETTSTSGTDATDAVVVESAAETEWPSGTAEQPGPDEQGGVADTADAANQLPPPPSGPSTGGGSSSGAWTASGAATTASAATAGAGPAGTSGADVVLVDSSARNWALLSHLAGLIATAFGGVPGPLGPLVVWLLKRDDNPYVAYNAAEAFNFQLSMLLYGILLVIASIPLITLVVTIPLGLIVAGTWIIAPILAAIRTSNGETWRYPFTIGFLRA